MGERLHTRWEILPIQENRLTDYLMPEVTWTGGISELKKIATLAKTFYIPDSPHDASGPIHVIAGAQVMMTARISTGSKLRAGISPAMMCFLPTRRTTAAERGKCRRGRASRDNAKAPRLHAFPPQVIALL